MKWWEDYPWRMIQTNLRETDMADIHAETYAEELAAFGATVVTLNAAGIIASYDTKHPYHTKSEYLTSDSLKALIEACHRRGIRVIARTDFTKVRYPLYEQHPEWACRTAEGEIINYNGNVHVCPNSDYQQKYLFEILRETLMTHPFDGVFCNMSGFVVSDYSGRYYGICHCENCRKKFLAFCGEELPRTEDRKDPVYLRYEAFKDQCMAEHRQRMNRMIKEISADIALNGVDYIRSESGSEIGRRTWIYSASGNARLAKGSDPARPSDNASVDYMGFRYRHISVSPELAALRQWQSLANGGSVSFYILGTLGNHVDVTAFEPTRRVFQFHKAHEQWFTNMRDASEVMLVSQGNWKRNDPECQGWIRALTESHIPFGEIIMEELRDPRQLRGKRVLILPRAEKLTARQAEMIDAFAADGGTVIQSGLPRTNEGRILACGGIRAIREIRRGCMSSMFEIASPEDRKAFRRCTGAPFIAPGEEIVLADWDDRTKKYLTLISEHPFGPPELCCFTRREPEPGVAVNRFGMGRCITVTFRVGTFYHMEGHSNSLRFMQDILFDLAGLPELAPDLTPMVELTWHETRGKYLLQMVNHSGIHDNACFPPLKIEDIRISLPGMAGKKAQTLNGGSVKAEDEGDSLLLTLSALHEYEGILVGE